MKKIFTGLLIAAAAAGVYYFLQNKKTTISTGVQKELLAGQWKMDTIIPAPGDSTTSLMTGLVSVIDSNSRKYTYDFFRDGRIFQSLNDSLVTDSSYYEWAKENTLIVRGSVADSNADSMFVLKLTMDSLVLQTTDSAFFLFTRIR